MASSMQKADDFDDISCDVEVCTHYVLMYMCACVCVGGGGYGNLNWLNNGVIY